MTEQSETSTSEGDLRRITVRRLTKVEGVTSRQLIRAVRITVADHPVRTINIAVVDDATIEGRRKNWKPVKPKITTGWLARYAKLVGSAAGGAVLSAD